MRRWKTWLGLAVSLLALFLASRGVEWSAVATSLALADWRILAVVFVLTPLVNVGIRAFRWRILLAPAARPSLAACTRATAIGLMANNVLPARAGEFVRAYALGRSERVPTGTAFGALFVERLLDGFALVGILYAVTLIHPFPGWVDTTVRIGFYVFGGFLAFQLLLAFRPALFVRAALWFSRVPLRGRLEEPIERAATTFVDGFRLLRRPLLVAVSLLLAFGQWSAISALYWIGLHAFDLAATAGWTGAFFTDSVTSLGVAVPSSPGFVGTFQAFVVESLTAFGIDRNAAFAYSVGFHAASYLSVTLVGLAAFARENLSWSELERSEEAMEESLEREFETRIEPRVDEAGAEPGRSEGR